MGANRAWRAAAAIGVVALGMTAIAGCDSGAGESGPEQPQENADELQERYAELEREVDVRAREVEERLRELRAPDGDGPATRLSRALGPKDPEATQDDLFDDACSDRGASCEVLNLEELLANDREDFAAEDEYSPNNCNITTETSYYRGYDLAETEDGAYYLGLRDRLSAAAEGLGEDADALVATAREMEEAEAEYEEASGFSAESERTLAEVEPLAREATEEGARAEEAFAAASERWEGYEGRAEELRAEALALHDRQGC